MGGVGPELPSKECEFECFKPQLFLGHCSNDITGAELVILEDRGQIHEIGYTEAF